MDKTANTQPEYNQITKEAVQEARDIMSGKISADIYESVEDLLTDQETSS